MTVQEDWDNIDLRGFSKATLQCLEDDVDGNGWHREDSIDSLKYDIKHSDFFMGHCHYRDIVSGITSCGFNHPDVDRDEIFKLLSENVKDMKSFDIVSRISVCGDNIFGNYFDIRNFKGKFDNDIGSKGKRALAKLHKLIVDWKKEYDDIMAGKLNLNKQLEN
tara:strand:+ start:1305 stop:1793 length:489 start_codon:yes stop_codon:yes gene_type:complete